MHAVLCANMHEHFQVHREPEPTAGQAGEWLTAEEAQGSLGRLPKNVYADSLSNPASLARGQLMIHSSSGSLWRDVGTLLVHIIPQ